MNKERTILYLFSINAIIYIASGFYTPFLSAYYAQKEQFKRDLNKIVK